jgi:putative ABC transport system permease protein
MKLTFILRMAWRDWRSGELGLLLIALTVAVGTVTSIGLFVDRLQQALVGESADFLAADRRISGSRPIPDEWRLMAADLGIELAETMSFPSMVFARRCHPGDSGVGGSVARWAVVPGAGYCRG